MKSWLAMTSRDVALVLLLCSAVMDAEQDKYFPSDVRICSAKDPNINECFLESTNKMISYLLSGMRKINAVPLDPLKIPLFELKKGNNLIPSLAYNMTNTVHTGWKYARATRASVKADEENFEVTFFIPHYHVHGDYTVTGRILFVPLEGTGDFNFDFYDCTYDVYVQGHTETQGQHRFFKIDQFRQVSDVGRLHVEIHNLFGNSVASNATNRILNLNSKAIMTTSLPMMDEMFGDMHAVLLQRIFDTVPYDELFTDLTI